MRINMQKVFPVASGTHFFIPFLQRKADILLPFGLKVRYDVVPQYCITDIKGFIFFCGRT